MNPNKPTIGATATTTGNTTDSMTHKRTTSMSSSIAAAIMFEDCNAQLGVKQYDLIAYNRASRDTRSLSVIVQDAGD